MCCPSRTTGKPLRSIRSRRVGPGRSSASETRAFGSFGRPRSGIASRTISTRSAAPSQSFGGSGSISASPAAREGHDPAAAGDEDRGEPRGGHRSGESLPGQFHQRFDDPAAIDKGGAVLADPLLVQPLSQSGIPPP
jgi:hypothetical protein